MKTSRNARVSPSLESLESRINLASASVTYGDVDGDLVRIKATLPGSAVPPLDVSDLSIIIANGAVARLDLTDPGFDNAKIVMSVTKQSGGDGLANIGFIDATGVDLDRVVVKGDLGRIVVGDAVTDNDPGLNLLKVDSMGRLGLATQDASGSLTSIVTGELGALKVKRDFASARLNVSGGFGIGGSIGSVSIGGSLLGGDAPDSGVVSAKFINSVKIGGSVIGGEGVGSGQIAATSTDGRIGAVTVGGSVVGHGPFSGVITSGEGGIGSVTIGGSVVGGESLASGLISSRGEISKLKIGGDVRGGSVSGSASLVAAGFIFGGRLPNVTIEGSLIAGTDASTGALSLCGAIVGRETLGSVTIKGSIVGNAANPAVISGKGRAVKPTSGFDVAIASVKVDGDVRFAQVLAGFDLAGGFNVQLSPANADASIGTIRVGGNWEASSVAAGVLDLGGPGFGTGDELQSAGDTPLVARIAGITIDGDVTGSATAGDHFGFVAQQVGKVKIGSGKLSLNDGPGNDNLLVPTTTDVRVLEVI